MFKKIATVVLLTAAATALAAPGGPGGPPGGDMGGGPGMGGPGGPGGRGARGGRGGTVPASLGAAMRDMGQTLKKITGEYTDDSKKEATINDLSTMERDIAVAKMGVPDKVAAMTGDEKTKALADYHKQLLALLVKFTDIEQAVNDGKNDQVKSDLADVQKMMVTGHKDFQGQ